MSTFARIWLVFTAIFGVLCVFHLVDSCKSITHFEVQEIEYNEAALEFYTRTTDVDLNAPLRKFGEDFNKYIDEVNASSKRQNRYAALGYFVAALTALASMFAARKS